MNVHKPKIRIKHQLRIIDKRESDALTSDA